MRKYQYVPSDKDDSESEEEEGKPDAAEVAEPVAAKVEDGKVKEVLAFIEPTTPIKPTTPFSLGLAGEPTPSQQSSAKRTRTDFEAFISKEDVDLMYEAQENVKRAKLAYDSAVVEEKKFKIKLINSIFKI